MRSTSLQIPSPCAESWEAMTPQGQGRHCASCQKVVIDFTQKTDAEILALLRAAAGGSTCGQFQASQLNRTLRQPEAPRPGWWSTAVAATVALLVGRSLAPADARAQTATNRHPRAGQHSPEPEFWQKAKPELPSMKGEVAVAAPDSTQRTSISGLVVDKESGEGLPGVTVLLQGTQHGVSTGADGSFTLSIEPTEQHLAIQINSIGFVTQFLPQPPDQQPMRVALLADSRQLGGLMVVTYSGYAHPLYTPQGVWSRLRSIPYRVRNVFR